MSLWASWTLGLRVCSSYVCKSAYVCLATSRRTRTWRGTLPGRRRRWWSDELSSGWSFPRTSAVRAACHHSRRRLACPRRVRQSSVVAPHCTRPPGLCYNYNNTPSPIHFTDTTLYMYTCTQKSSVIAQKPRDALCQLKSCQLLHGCTKKACSRWMTLKVTVTQGHRNCRYLIGHIWLSISGL